MPCHIEGTYKV
jgi:hypothetical protein